MRRVAGLLTVLLAGCASTPPEPVPPQVVRVPVTVYAAVPPELTARVPVEMPAANTVAEAVRVARARRAALEQCNAQLDAIRALGAPEPTP